jgi:hypothetical protein
MIIKVTTFILLVMGLVFSVWVGFFNFFVGGIQLIITTASIVDGRIVLSDWHTVVGCVKIVVSGVVFWFILSFFLNFAANFYKNSIGNYEENS